MRKTFLLLIVAATLAACGLKGPLYIPEKKYAAALPATADTPADEKKSPGAK